MEVAAFRDDAFGIVASRDSDFCDSDFRDSAALLSTTSRNTRLVRGIPSLRIDSYASEICFLQLSISASSRFLENPVQYRQIPRPSLNLNLTGPGTLSEHLYNEILAISLLIFSANIWQVFLVYASLFVFSRHTHNFRQTRGLFFDYTYETFEILFIQNLIKMGDVVSAVLPQFI